MTDTPRTAIESKNTVYYVSGRKYVSLEFAEQLERELIQMTNERDKWIREYISYIEKTAYKSCDVV